MFRVVFTLLVNTPFYPHWLSMIKANAENDELISHFYGRVLETGCGNCVKKERALQLNKKIKEYIATDYSSWDEDFTKQARIIESLGMITHILYGKAKDKARIDVECNALDLQFKKNSFDVYYNYSVLEHIEDPVQFFAEAYRVLKKGGLCITSTPFLYRDHGGIEKDFYRFTKGGYQYLAKRTGFTIEHIYTYSYFGTTIASMINHYIIRKIAEGPIIIRIALFLVSPFIFFVTNMFGFIIDIFDHDDRFAYSYCVIMRK